MCDFILALVLQYGRKDKYYDYNLHVSKMYFREADLPQPTQQNQNLNFPIPSPIIF